MIKDIYNFQRQLDNLEEFFDEDYINLETYYLIKKEIINKYVTGVKSYE